MTLQSTIAIVTIIPSPHLSLSFVIVHSGYIIIRELWNVVVVYENPLHLVVEITRVIFSLGWKKVLLSDIHY